jgi:hypothetical protein
MDSAVVFGCIYIPHGGQSNSNYIYYYNFTLLKDREWSERESEIFWVLKLQIFIRFETYKTYCRFPEYNTYLPELQNAKKSTKLFKI